MRPSRASVKPARMKTKSAQPWWLESRRVISSGVMTIRAMVSWLARRSMSVARAGVGGRRLRRTTFPGVVRASVHPPLCAIGALEADRVREGPRGGDCGDGVLEDHLLGSAILQDQGI